MEIVSVAQMAALEKEANQGGLTFDEMMARAGAGLAKIIHQDYSRTGNNIVLGLIGSGKNGGDALIALTALSRKGWKSFAYIVKERAQDDPLVTGFLAEGGEAAYSAQDRTFTTLKKWIRLARVIVDGILGTGIQLPLRGEIPRVLGIVQQARKDAVVVAVDCPSGVDCESGEAAAESLRADLTISMAAVKRGLLEFPAFGLVGEIRVVDIGLPRSLKAWKPAIGEMLTRGSVAGLLPNRQADAHKGTFGSCMIIAGSVNYCGAVLLASRGAMRVGTGLVRACIPAVIYDALAGKQPELTWLVLPPTDGVISREGASVALRHMDRISAVLLGPGLGVENTTADFVADFLARRTPSAPDARVIGFSGNRVTPAASGQVSLPPLVIDADGLRLLVKMNEWHKRIPRNSVLTPHPGEMSILTGLPVETIQKDRLGIAKRFSKEWGQVVVLKGALTVIAEPQGGCAVTPFATSALATAGTGDVLAGMIAGFLAQGLDPFSASKAGAWVHAQAGIISARHLGNEASVLAGEVADAIPQALNTTTGILD